MKVRSDTILASFVVAVFSSFLTALGVILLKSITAKVLSPQAFANIVINLLILFFLAGFIFLRGSIFAAWLLYRHDVAWGYKLEFKKVIPIFLLSFFMAVAVYGAVTAYITQEVHALAYLEQSRALLQRFR